MIKIEGMIEKTIVEAEELRNHIGKAIRIHGSIYKIRKMSDFAFILLRTKREIVQCIYSREMTKFLLEELVEESCVIITAYVKEESRSKKDMIFKYRR